MTVVAERPSSTLARRNDRAGRSGAIVQVLLNLGRGGMEAMAVGLACALQRVGHRSVVIALDDGGEHEEVLRDARVRYYVMHGRRFRSPSAHMRILRILRTERARAVHTHHFPTLLHTLPAVKLAGVHRLIHTEHSFQYLRTRVELRWLLRGMSRMSDGFVVVGSEMEAFYRDRVRVPLRLLHVVQNGVDSARYVRPADVQAARVRAGLPQGFLVGSAGRLFPEKDQGVLIGALQIACAAIPDLRLVLIGDGPERQELERQARARGVCDRVHFLGWRRDMPDILPLLDVFALSSRHEGLPLVILEAMAAAVPIVSTPVGDLPQVAPDGEAALFYPIGSPETLAEQLVRLAKDVALRDRLGSAASARVRGRYSHDAMMERYLELYAF